MQGLAADTKTWAACPRTLLRCSLRLALRLRSGQAVLRYISISYLVSRHLRPKRPDSLLLTAQFYILNPQLSFILYQTSSGCSMKIELFYKNFIFITSQIENNAGILYVNGNCGLWC
jgi:hypothetical protein